jgi:hypothetical protein
MPIASIILIIAGLIYLVKPDIHKEGIGKKPTVTQKLLSPKQYIIYMRVLGIISIVLALAIASILRR